MDELDEKRFPYAAPQWSVDAFDRLAAQDAIEIAGLRTAITQALDYLKQHAPLEAERILQEALER